MKPDNKTTDTKATVALTFEIVASASGDVPTEAHLLPSGYFRSDDGRPRCCAAWFLDAMIAAQVIARMSAKKNDTLIDFEHQSLNAEWNGQPAPAAGWFNTLEFRDTGLYATNIAWVEDTKALITAKKYRYISAVFTYYEGTGEVLEIISVALTNSPALDGLDALVQLSKRLSLPTINDAGTLMPDSSVAVLTAERDNLKTQTAALTAERDDLKVKVATLSTENATLSAKISTLEQEKATAALADEKKQCAELLQAALNSGKVPPAMKPYLERKTDLADLKAALESFAPLSLFTKQHTQESETGNHGLSDTELAMCTRMGVSPEDFKKNKEA